MLQSVPQGGTPATRTPPHLIQRQLRILAARKALEHVAAGAEALAQGAEAQQQAVELDLWARRGVGRRRLGLQAGSMPGGAAAAG